MSTARVSWVYSTRALVLANVTTAPLCVSHRCLWAASHRIGAAWSCVARQSPMGSGEGWSKGDASAAPCEGASAADTAPRARDEDRGAQGVNASVVALVAEGADRVELRALGFDAADDVGRVARSGVLGASGRGRGNEGEEGQNALHGARPGIRIRIRAFSPLPMCAPDVVEPASCSCASRDDGASAGAATPGTPFIHEDS